MLVYWLKKARAKVDGITEDLRETRSTRRAEKLRRPVERQGQRSIVKKSLHASEQDRPDVARRRAQWQKYQGRLDPSRLVFIDET
jgi:hypothetical protein